MIENFYFLIFLVFFIVCEKFCKARNRSIYFPIMADVNDFESEISKWMQTLKISFIVMFSLSFSVVSSLVFLPIFFAFLSLIGFIFLKNRR